MPDRYDLAAQPLETTSQSYVGRWNRLVSTTNWDKGRIIHEWRSALTAAGAPQTEFSDEAWSRLVGGVTGQHAGRLRRVYERFGDVFSQYEGLYWSHFQSALDWDDAEMWLEGALHSDWSVAEMRRRRWETLGGVAAEEPREADVVAAEVDEDYETIDSSASTLAEGTTFIGDYAAEGIIPEGPDFGDDIERHGGGNLHESFDAEDFASPAPNSSGEAVRPFAELPALPDDMAAAFESFQLAILRQRSNDWFEVAADDVLASLDALKTLVTAPRD